MQQGFPQPCTGAIKQRLQTTDRRQGFSVKNEIPFSSLKLKNWFLYWSVGAAQQGLQTTDRRQGFSAFSSLKLKNWFLYWSVGAEHQGFSQPCSRDQARTTDCRQTARILSFVVQCPGWLSQPSRRRNECRKFYSALALTQCENQSTWERQSENSVVQWNLKNLQKAKK